MLGARRFRRRRTVFARGGVDDVAVAPIVDARVALLVRRRATDVGGFGGESFASAASLFSRPVRRVRPALEAARLSHRKNRTQDSVCRDSRRSTARRDSDESHSRRVRRVGKRRARRYRRGVGGDALAGERVTGAVRKHDKGYSGSPRFDPAR
jgi:hypothetical protein